MGELLMASKLRDARCLLLILLAGLFFQPACVQASALQNKAKHGAYFQYADADISSFWALLNRMDKRLNRVHAMHSDMKSYVDQVLAPACVNLMPLGADGRSLRAEARAAADDPGIDLEVGARKGLDTNKGFSGQSGSQSAFMGLRWDLLRSGWRENKRMSKLLGTQASAADIRARMEFEDRLNQCRADKVHQGFLPLQATLLRLKVDLLRNLWRLQLKSYLSGNSFFDDALAVEQELQVASNDLAALQPELAEFPVDHAAAVMSPPVLDVDIKRIMAAINKDPRVEQLSELDKKIYAQKKDRLDSARLQLSLRYELKGRGFNRHGPAGSIRYIQPLFEDNLAGLRMRQLSIDQKKDVLINQRIRDTNRAYAKFNEERERAVRQWYRYLRVEERVRRSLKEQLFDPESADGAAAAQRAMELIDAAIELARAKELLYRRADEMFSRAQILYEPDFVRLGAVVNNSYRARNGVRSVYVWSKTFNAHSNDFLGSFLQAKGIRSVLLSAGKHVDKDKLEAFIVAARVAHISVELLFSDNGWLKPEHYDRALSQIISLTVSQAFVHAEMLEENKKALRKRHIALQNLGGNAVHLETKRGKRSEPDAANLPRSGIGMIHLDIEPHAVAALKGKPDKIQSTYLALLRYLRSHLPETLRMSVSLPAHWKAEDYRRISELVDSVVIMDYGSADPERILRRLKSARDAIPDYKLTLAIRASDFNSERELEQAVDTIMQRTSIRHFAIQALGGYLKLSNRPQNAQPPRLIHTSRRVR
ncbi:MAG: hypothetical protein Q9M82_02790 [Mariprofundus sp.]|nr:hypothetical protein [Mariprofundus sp.]